MKRRAFLSLLGGAATAWPLAARAQQPAVPVIGFLRNTTAAGSASVAAAMNEGLREEGFVDGKNVTIDYRWADNQQDRLPALAADLVRRQVAVIVGGGNEPALAAKAATATIPIVFATGNDPVEIGLVASMNRPDANLTGASWVSKAIVGKRLELLHQLVPNAAVIGLLSDPNGNPIAETETEQRLAIAAALSNGVRLLVLTASSEHDIDAAFQRFVRPARRRTRWSAPARSSPATLSTSSRSMRVMRFLRATICPSLPWPAA